MKLRSPSSPACLQLSDGQFPAPVQVGVSLGRCWGKWGRGTSVGGSRCRCRAMWTKLGRGEGPQEGEEPWGEGLGPPGTLPCLSRDLRVLVLPPL